MSESTAAPEAQVLIAGAGPVGLFLAASLRRLGVATRIVEPAAARTDKSKALVVWPRTLETLDIHGIADQFVAAGMQVGQARIAAGARTLARVDLTGVASRYNYALFLPQSETERLLEQEVERLGPPVERRVALDRFVQDKDGVTATLRGADGTETTVRAAYLVGCDGAHSAVRHGLDLKFEGATEPSNWMLADLMLDGPVVPEVLVCWRPDGVLAIFPITPGRFRIIADLGEGAPPTADPTLADVQAVLERRGPPGIVARDPIWLSHFRINERKVADYSVGRVFVAGDAAHIHSPAGGQGMNTGLQDAANLAWKLALVCRGAARPALLNSYSPERSAIGRLVLRNAEQLTHLAILRGRIPQALRNVGVAGLSHLPVVQRRIADALTELDLHYTDSPLNAGTVCTLRPGDRAPDCATVLPDGSKQRLAELQRDGRFVVLSESAIDAPERLAVVARALDTVTYPSFLHHVVRPDGYIALSAEDRVEAARYLWGLAA